jgi:hypothetical protein
MIENKTKDPCTRYFTLLVSPCCLLFIPLCSLLVSSLSSPSLPGPCPSLGSRWPHCSHNPCCPVVVVTVPAAVRGPPDEVYNHLRPSRILATTCEHLRTPANTCEHHRDTCDLIAALATSSRPHRDRFASHYDHPRYTV